MSGKQIPLLPRQPWGKSSKRDGLPPHAPQSPTSAAAAEKQLPKLAQLQRRYFRLLQDEGPLTDHEAARLLRKPLSSINARRNELQGFEPPLVVSSGKKRPTEFGGEAVAWQVNPEVDGLELPLADLIPQRGGQS